jgi:ubiquinone/menaquinone biosynthesis C-methylase UbiE
MIDPTIETKTYWDTFSPYMDYLENVIGINSDNLDPIIPLVKSPVLVVGAGQGLLVGELRKRGLAAEGIDFSPQMVAGAEKRRGIKLFLGNANDMPFENGQFSASLVATGVIDFLDDRGQIGAIINETRRVTCAQGEVFVALLGLTPQTEELLKYIGILSDNQVDLKIFGQMLTESQSPLREIIRVVRRVPNKSVAVLVYRFIRSLMSTRKRATARIRSLMALMKKVKRGEVADPKILVAHFPERAFLRSDKQIRVLFAALNFPPRKIFVFDNCKIARL